jgi:hypothetical protein
MRRRSNSRRVTVIDRELRYDTANGQFRHRASFDAGRPVETPAIVACRYRTTLCP